MDPDTSGGARKLPTRLDLASLDDMGWELITPTIRVTGDHIYGDNGSYTASIQVTGSRLGTIAVPTTIAITNVVPTLIDRGDRTQTKISNSRSSTSARFPTQDSINQPHQRQRSRHLPTASIGGMVRPPTRERPLSIAKVLSISQLSALLMADTSTRMLGDTKSSSPSPTMIAVRIPTSSLSTLSAIQKSPFRSIEHRSEKTQEPTPQRSPSDAADSDRSLPTVVTLSSSDTSELKLPRPLRSSLAGARRSWRLKPSTIHF